MRLIKKEVKSKGKETKYKKLNLHLILFITDQEKLQRYVTGRNLCKKKL